MILIVVLGHASSIFAGNYAGHNQVESLIGETVHNIIYTFHMAVFMAISGYLFGKRQTVGVISSMGYSG
jgi:fucose 4-O-acetylase-like acetyltransferase